MLALALAFHDVRDQLRHGLVVAWWPGHSNARYAGSTWFADEHFTDLRTRGLAYMNIDGVGQMEAKRFGASASEAFQPFAARVVEETQGEEISPSRPGRNSDPGLQRRRPAADPVQPYPAGGRRRLLVWHTPDDTYDKIDGDVLKTDTDIYADALAEMLANPRYPVSLSAQVASLAEAVAARDAASGGALGLGERLGGRLVGLREASERLDELADAGSVGPLDQVAVLRPLHRVMYVPLNAYHPDPGVGLGPLPGLAPARILSSEDAGGDRRGFAATGLARERNRLVEAIDQALSTAVAVIRAAREGRP